MTSTYFPVLIGVLYGFFIARFRRQCAPLLRQPVAISLHERFISSRRSPGDPGPRRVRREQESDYCFTRDQDGNALHGDRHYRVIGRLSTPGYWWSVALYDGTGSFILNRENRYAFTSFNAIPTDDGQAIIDIAPHRPAGALNWLPCREGETFSVYVRLYRSRDRQGAAAVTPDYLFRVEPAAPDAQVPVEESSTTATNRGDPQAPQYAPDSQHQAY